MHGADFSTSLKVMTAPTNEVNLSDLLNKPKDTLAKLDSHRRIRVRRRDAEDLELTTVERAEQDRAFTSAVVRLLTELTNREPGVLAMAVDVLPQVFPWVRYLPEDARQEFAAEWVDALSAGASVGNGADVATLIAEWRSTAEIYGDPELYARLTMPHDGTDYGPVPMPEVPE
jgi:hypothetical protein